MSAEMHAYSCGHASHLRQARCPGCGRGLLIQRHADHEPGLICRPAGFGLCELAPLEDYLDRRARLGSETAATG